MTLNKRRVAEIVRAALKEDVGRIDVTTASLVNKNTRVSADIITREDGIACGLPVTEAVFESLDAEIKFKPQVADGDTIYKDKVLCYLEGPARAILTGERVALNFLGRLCGIATIANKYAKKCEPHGVKLMDTRKTAPGLRYLEKYAVKAGGGHNHRMGLWDQILIKDNHLKVAGQKQGLDNLLKELRRKVQKNLKIEIEVDSVEDFQEALNGRPDIILLDNMKPAEVKRAVSIRNRHGSIPFIEVSGNITIDNIEEYAGCKPDMISVGSITHSVRALDLSLELYG
jgi:nicotinate-nucleotide pyrophosphorylase (carboxylating)